MNRTAIIGSGVAGLASALRFRAKGYEVDVYESAPFLGGKLAELRQDDFRFDMGPSLFTLPNLVEELFDLFGENINDHFEYVRLETVCKYFWEDGSRFTASANPDDFIRDCAETFSVPESEIRNYLNAVVRRYELTVPTFLEKSLHRSSTWLSRELIQAMGEMTKLGFFSTLHDLNERSFSNPKLVQLFDRYATYNGSSPYLTPGVMSVIPYLEYYTGAYFPTKGMRSIPESLVALGERHGIRYHVNTTVEQILVDKGIVKGIVVNGNSLPYDAVASNMDIVPTYRKLLKDQPAPEKTLNQTRSASAIVFYWNMNTAREDLDVHNIFFSEDYKTEFDLMFTGEEPIDDPTIYLHVSNKVTGTDAPAGKENWFVMINAPAHKGKEESAAYVNKARKNVIDKLNRCLNMDVESLIEAEYFLTPFRIEERTHSYKGSLYGTASNSMFAGLLRHPNFSRKIKNLYFCGGSVHPGGGVPVCLNSAKIVDSFVPELIS